MEYVRFISWEAAKVLALIFLAMVAAKGIAGWVLPQRWLKSILYGLLLAMIGTGAWFAGNDIAAEVFAWSSSNSMSRGDLIKGYASAMQAVHLRPNNVSYWHDLMQAKMSLHQLDSVLEDQPAMTSLSGGALDSEDEYQFALCAYFLGQYDKVVATTLRLIRQDPSYAAPYVLEGLAYTAQSKYQEAQQSFLAVLQLFPNNRAAVENLARAYYLGGDRQRALAVLNETSKYQFDAGERQRFEALKGLYGQ